MLIVAEYFWCAGGLRYEGGRLRRSPDARLVSGKAQMADCVGRCPHRDAETLDGKRIELGTLYKAPSCGVLADVGRNCESGATFQVVQTNTGQVRFASIAVRNSIGAGATMGPRPQARSRVNAQPATPRGVHAPATS